MSHSPSFCTLFSFTLARTLCFSVPSPFFYFFLHCLSLFYSPFCHFISHAIVSFCPLLLSFACSCTLYISVQFAFILVSLALSVSLFSSSFCRTTKQHATMSKALELRGDTTHGCFLYSARSTFHLLARCCLGSGDCMLADCSARQA
jgi:hypothetical protein